MIENPEPLKPTGIMIKMIIVSAIVIVAIGAVAYRSFAVIPFALGVFASAGLNILKLRMLERTVQKVINMENQETGKNLVRLQYHLRYILTGVVLVAIGLIDNFTTPPIVEGSRSYFAAWAAIFPNGPASLLSAPLISVWGAILGIFTMQLSVIMIRFMKPEKDGTNFIKYEDDDELEFSDDADKELIEDNISVDVVNDTNKEQ